jgi:UDP-N-acetylmuramoyl-tripeptide--D-alanyl-D-alanine ligase
MATPIPSNRAAFRLGEVAEITGGALHGKDVACQGVSSDTRAALGGQLFVALAGASFDGHRFIEDALAKGAVAVLSERPLPPNVNGVVVPSTLLALGELGRAHRQRWGGKLVAVAGSAGKTTTKSIIAALFRHELGSRVHVAPGNLNNQIGVPMVLLGLEEQHSAAIVELGTNHTGEVPALVHCSRPDFAVLTLIDLEHTEGLGGIDAIELEEGAVYRSPLDVALGNADDALVLRQLRAANAVRKLGYGFCSAADYRILGATLTAECTTRLELERPDGTRLSLTTPWLGTPGALSTTAAIAALEAYRGANLDPTWIAEALAQPGLREAGRLQPFELGDGSLVIDDSYNANPASVRTALAVAREVASLRNARLLVVLGEMRELGKWSQSEHEGLRPAIAAAQPSSVFAIAGDAKYWAQPGSAAANAEFFPDSSSAARRITGAVKPGDVVLVKASRGVRAELVVQALVNDRGLRA